MNKISIAILLALSLGGCATQFGTRIPHAVHSNAPVVSHSPAVAPPVAAAPAVAPKATFKQRWLSKFFRKRAQQ